jgi:CheY-like chemotaxis protein/HPt (histidine-containing phosphotransfer) domain-containing protein
LDSIVGCLAKSAGPKFLPPPSAGAVAEESIAGAALRILLVEDNATNQMLVHRVLQKQGHAITVAGNGREALARLQISDWQVADSRSVGGAFPFDLILMDVQMPEMDGLEATAAIRAHEKKTGSHIPILAMTAHAMKGDREECLGAGMDGYLSKPIQPAELRRAITALVAQEKLLAAKGPQMDESKRISLIGNSPSQAVDRAAALEVAGGDAELLKGLITCFLSDCPGLLVNLRAALAAQDGRALHGAAHAIKGSVNLFGATDAWNEAQRLETMGRQNEFIHAAQVCAAVEAQIERVKQELAAFLQDISEGISDGYRAHCG